MEAETANQNPKNIAQIHRNKRCLRLVTVSSPSICHAHFSRPSFALARLRLIPYRCPIHPINNTSTFVLFCALLCYFFGLNQLIYVKNNQICFWRSLCFSMPIKETKHRWKINSEAREFCKMEDFIRFFSLPSTHDNDRVKLKGNGWCWCLFR